MKPATDALRPNPPLLKIVLQSLITLVPRQPTVFRPFSLALKKLCTTIVDTYATDTLLPLSAQLIACLENFVDKDNESEKWRNRRKSLILHMHKRVDRLFRPVVEQWESVDRNLKQGVSHQNHDDQEVPESSGVSDFPDHRGIRVAATRIKKMTNLLSLFLTTATSSTVSIPLGSILDFTSRVASVTVPGDNTEILLNLEIDREEREALWDELPRVHSRCIELLINLVDVLDKNIIPVAYNILEQALWIFRAEKFDEQVRTLIYVLIRKLISIIGPSMSKSNVHSLSDLFRSSCSDLLLSTAQLNPETIAKGKGNQNQKQNQTSLNADSFLNNTENSAKQQQQQQQQQHKLPSSTSQAASDLLTVTLNSIPTEHIPTSLRAEIDRTMILTNDKYGMLASVLNPMPVIRGKGAAPSIMPFLARSYADDVEVETLIKPRMPVLLNVGGFMDIDPEEEEEEENKKDGKTGDLFTFPPLDISTSSVHVAGGPNESHNNDPNININAELAETEQVQRSSLNSNNKRDYDHTATDEVNNGVDDITEEQDESHREIDNISTTNKKPRLNENTDNTFATLYNTNSTNRQGFDLVMENKEKEKEKEKTPGPDGAPTAAEPEPSSSTTVATVAQEQVVLDEGATATTATTATTVTETGTHTGDESVHASTIQSSLAKSSSPGEKEQSSSVVQPEAQPQEQPQPQPQPQPQTDVQAEAQAQTQEQGSSDEEMPTLNIDPDTEDEDEDTNDVNMDG